MGRLIPLLFLIEVALVVVALISCLSAEDDEIRTLPRVGWILIILFFPLVGAIAWFSAGRPLPAGDGLRIGRLSGYRPGTRGGWTRPPRWRRTTTPSSSARSMSSRPGATASCSPAGRTT